ncbi:hypothetical protein [Inquilinus sp. CAU 1745]|uniref:hypothetical protein n=1 Tax=Inquilinus sp. CAU 1745 TaxID=3140369 RepID=UPI00325BB8F0
MNVLYYPLRYLVLKDECGRPVYRRNLISALAIAIALTFPFFFSIEAYFGDNGFLDRFGSFSAVLTGFYIAALVGVASFASAMGDLDDVIEVGKVSRIAPSGDREYLTRRQYVCSMFGYLAFLSLFISIAAIMLVTISGVNIWLVLDTGLITQVASWILDNVAPALGMATIFLVNILLSHMIVTTCHGLYYLIDRLYETKPRLLKKAGVAARN